MSKNRWHCTRHTPLCTSRNLPEAEQNDAEEDEGDEGSDKHTEMLNDAHAVSGTELAVREDLCNHFDVELF
eukprot:1149447-Pelagomonas_calceolata.AAC.4